MQLTVTGTGTPIPCPGRAGPGALVRSGGTLLQVDAGRATVLRLAEAGVSPADLTALLVTHHHSDHMADIADLVITRWICGGSMPFPVIVPDGPAARMLEHLVEFWADDIEVRRLHGNRRNRPELRILPFVPRDDRALVWQDREVTVAAVAVRHEPVLPAVAYRVDGPAGSVTISGDTRVCATLVELASGTEILLHEAMRTDAVLASGIPHVAAYHADTRQLGRAAADMAVGTLVLTHLEPAPTDTGAAALFAEEVRAGGFSGHVVVARDLVTVDHTGTVYW